MNIRTMCWAALLMVIGCMVAAQAVLAQSNLPCAGVSATAFVNWPQFHSDPCHTGYNPNEFLLSPATVGNLVLERFSCYCIVYPQCANQAMALFGVIPAKASVMADSSVSRVRVLAERSCCLIFDQACSMGLKSGE